jgi:hypothetical protein
MPKEITEGWVVDPEKERIIGLGEELSAVISKHKIKIEKREGAAGFTHYLTVTNEEERTQKEYVLHEKIPPDTGGASLVNSSNTVTHQRY